MSIAASGFFLHEPLIVDSCGGASGAVLDELAAWTKAAAGAAGLSDG